MTWGKCQKEKKLSSCQRNNILSILTKIALQGVGIHRVLLSMRITFFFIKLSRSHCSIHLLVIPAAADTSAPTPVSDTSKRAFAARFAVAARARRAALGAEIVEVVELLGEGEGAGGVDSDDDPDGVAEEDAAGGGHAVLGLVDPGLGRAPHLHAQVHPLPGEEGAVDWDLEVYRRNSRAVMMKPISCV